MSEFSSEVGKNYGESESDYIVQDQELRRMREASGDIESDDPLVAFLYLLSRDEITTGRIEALIDQATILRSGPCVFTNGWLASWATDAAERLSRKPNW